MQFQDYLQSWCARRMVDFILKVLGRHHFIVDTLIFIESL